MKIKDSSITNVKFTKTILMLFVMFGHACAFWSGHWFTENPMIQSQALATLYSWIDSFHIYAFTLVSGYLFAFKVRGGGTTHMSLFCRTKPNAC